MKSDRMNFKLTAGLLALALVIGGAGVSFPLLQLLLGGAAVVVAALFVVTSAHREKGPLDRWAWVLLGLTLLLPLLQLIPLPPAIWPQLPGRDLPRELDAILGWKVWRPWTLDVEATVRSWLVLIPASVVFAGCLRLGTRERVQLLWLVVGFALLNALLGIVQLATGGGNTPYPSSHSGFPVGFFVNRNHSAALMLAAMPIAAALGSTSSMRAQGRANVKLAAASVVAVLTIVVIGTTSRTGLLLLPVSLLVSLFLLFGRQLRPRIAVPALFGIAALGLVLVTSRGFDRVLDRFASDDPRFAYWTDVHWALQQYGLAGTGVGTFVPVFQSAESLEAIVPQVINHAHNDYLEILLVGGIPAALLFGAFLVLIGLAIHRGITSARQPEMASLRFAAATGLALLLGYSMVDYPLRMPAIAAVFAVCCAVLLPAARPRARASGQELSTKSVPENRSGGRLRLKSQVGLGLLALVAVVMVQASLSARGIAEKRYDDASHWAFWSTKANDGQAVVELAQNHPREAWRRAAAALRLSPISASSIRDLALMRLVAGSSEGDKLMQVAAVLGWRDSLTQLWAIGAARSTDEPDKAMQRAEALFRQQTFIAPALQLLLQEPRSERASQLLVDRLAQRPSWRNEVLFALGAQSASDLSVFRAIVSGLKHSSAPLTSDEVKPLLNGLITRGGGVEAQQLWNELNPALIDNGEFNSFRDTAGVISPMGWDVPSQSRRMVTVARDDSGRGNRALRIGHTGWVTAVSQDTMLPPGSYTFSFHAREVGRTPVTLRWQLRCRGSRETQVFETPLPVDRRWRPFAATFNVPLQDCLIQRLVLKRIGDNDQTETWLDHIRFARNAR